VRIYVRENTYTENTLCLASIRNSPRRLTHNG
jgi:hypothetical protein